MILVLKNFHGTLNDKNEEHNEYLNYLIIQNSNVEIIIDKKNCKFLIIKLQSMKMKLLDKSVKVGKYATILTN